MCCIALVRCVLVLQCGSAGVVWYPYAGWSTASACVRIQHHPSRTTPTHIEPEQYNQWDKSTISRKLLKMDVLTFETFWAVNSEIMKRVTSSWSLFIHIYIYIYIRALLSWNCRRRITPKSCSLPTKPQDVTFRIISNSCLSVRLLSPATQWVLFIKSVTTLW